MEFVYEYFDRYYYLDDEKEKEEIFEDFFLKLWEHAPKMRTFKRGDRYIFRGPKRDDDSFTFLKAYINYLYMYFCSPRVFTKAKKMNYDGDYYRKVIHHYIKDIFEKYLPSEIYAEENPGHISDTFYDSFGDDSYVCAYICQKLKFKMINRKANYFKEGWYGDCECGAQFRKKRINSSKKYCKDCAKENKKKQTVESKHRLKCGKQKRFYAVPGYYENLEE